MLPDLPRLKRDIESIFIGYLRLATQRRLGPFADVPRHIVHEGKDMRIHRADGTVEDTPMKETSADMSMNVEEVPNMSFNDRVRKFDKIADAMAEQMKRNMFQGLNEVLEKAGQVIDARGKPLDAETIFAVLEKVQIDFDKRGNPAEGMRFVIHPSLAPRVQQLIEQEKNDPSIKKRHEEIMAKKWLEWRDREAARKLVG
jgi:hypothetical protein